MLKQIILHKLAIGTAVLGVGVAGIFAAHNTPKTQLLNATPTSSTAVTAKTDVQTAGADQEQVTTATTKTDVATSDGTATGSAGTQSTTAGNTDSGDDTTPTTPVEPTPVTPPRTVVNEVLTYRDSITDSTQVDAYCTYTFSDGTTLERWAGSKPKVSTVRIYLECAAL